MNRFIILLLVSLASTALASKSKPVCGEATDSKEFDLLAPALPQRECRYRIKAYSSHVCQLRLNFSMVLAQPSKPDYSNDNHVECVKDYLHVAGLRLCGVEMGQHLYVPLNRTAGVTEVDIEIVLAARSGSNALPTPSWTIAVTQLECPSASGSVLRELEVADAAIDELPLKWKVKSQARSIKDDFHVAPVGCLQYFPEANGVIKSFNYNNGKGIYPGNLNYAICFRRTSQTHALEVFASNFSLGSESTNNKFMQIDNQCYPQLHIDGVSEDYLMVPQSLMEDSDVRATYYCGNSLQGTTIKSTNPGPIMMVFNSDGNKKGTEAGFSLSYRITDF